MKKTRITSFLKSGWTILAIVLLFSAFGIANWYLFSRTRSSLEKEFGKRLSAIARSVSASLEKQVSILETQASDGIVSSSPLRKELENIRDENLLANVFILREDFVILLSLEEEIYPEGLEYPHWRMDYDAIQNALTDETASTALHRIGHRYLAAGYAPLRLGKTDAVVGVEASAEFLETLDSLAILLFAVTGISAAGVVLFALFALKATSSLMETRESLARAETLAAMGRMAAGIAHEIRNPLFIIRSGAEKLRTRHPESADQIREYILEEVDRLSSILGDYLSFARDEPLEKREMDLTSTVKRTLKNFQNSISNREVEIEEASLLPEAPFFGEEKRIEQVLINLLLNAYQSIVGKGKISLSLRLENGRYLLAISDTGAGIPPKALEKIFDPFYSTKPKGSGLGLSIAKKVIESHGGKIIVESAAGKGTTVSISLPVPDRIVLRGAERGGRVG